MDITIKKVNDQFGWLSCMSAHPITYNNQQYKTCEALFQSLRFEDYPDLQREIRECKSPMGAKMIARKNREKLNRGKMWDESPEDLDRMKLCLNLKLDQHPDLKGKLVATDNSTIIEDCTTHDRESARFWGAVNKTGKWEGENKLGNLWMEIRNELLGNIIKNEEK